jgi:acyl-CoA thioester hydrolase
MSGLLDQFPVIVTIPVAWGDMDYFRHVYNTVYFRYFESARIAYLDRIGFREALEESGIGPILASTHARFRRPLTYPDTVQVGARTTEVQPDRFVMEYRLVSERDNCTAADGGGVLVAYDYSAGRRALLPDRAREQIARVERWAGQVV